MPYGYIYSPISGPAISVDCYCSESFCGLCPTNSPCGCDSCVHIVVRQWDGFCCPLDIGGYTDQYVSFRSNSTVNSIKIEYFSGICSTATGDINNGILVHVYRQVNASCYMATVQYSHLKNREAFVTNNQVINRPTSISTFTKTLGQLPAVPAGQSCYRGAHIHMAIKHGSRRSFTSCNTSLTTGTWVYNWYWNDGYCL
jgi:hypothetical protein